MKKTHAALFVGGPWDGEMRVLEQEYPVYCVRDHQTLGYPAGLMAGTAAVNEYVKYTDYRRQELAGRVFYLADLAAYDERRTTDHPMERLVRMLAVGYKRV